ncbi:MAG: MFS transporter [Oscillospiraceae bacterium]|nr:MFS transporter [Oscillospiraceae bacterium]
MPRRNIVRDNSLIRALLSLRGNTRACVYTEPLWSIPYTLFSPFVTVYMAALLLSDRQIGLVASVTMLIRALSALLGGAVTDKLGRKMTTFIFDLLAWSVPCLLWAFSQNFWWFMAAAAFNGLMQVTDNSWTCLLVEDAGKSNMVKIYSLVHISGQLAVIFAPLSALLVDRLTLVPAMRILYLFTFVSMTAKFIILYRFCGETTTGTIRKRETRGMSLWKIMSGYGQIFKRIFSSREMRLALVIASIFNITSMIMGSFFGLYTTGNLDLPRHYLAYFPILRSVIIAFFLFVLQPALTRFGFRALMLAGLLFYAASHALLICAPKGSLALPLAYILLEACGHSLVMPRRDSLVALLIEPAERARINGIMTVMILGGGIPFGYLAGWLSDTDRRLPFLLDIAIFALAFAVIAANRKLLAQKDAPPAAANA